MITTEIKGYMSLASLEAWFIRDISARSVAKVGREFSDFLKYRRFGELFKDQTGETRESIGLHRHKSKKIPGYVIRAGIGIPGNLNYLAGMYRNDRVTSSGKKFYSKQRNLIDGGWKLWGAEQKAVAVGEKMLQRAVNEAEKKLEG